jgi:hypothetical protein
MKLFYLRVNGRKRKKHIEDKEQEIARHFGELLRTKHHMAFSLNWEELNCPSFNLADLEVDIIGEEVERAVVDMPKENAPGPDGFIGAFYSTCWATVQSDLIQAVHQLTQLRGNNFNLLNMANIVLLPKKEKVECIGDYRPISLVHSVAKLFSKILASSLALRLVEMVSSSQSTFVKK